MDDLNQFVELLKDAVTDCARPEVLEQLLAGTNDRIVTLQRLSQRIEARMKELSEVQVGERKE